MSICWSSTRRPAWSCTPRAGIARARSRSCLAGLAAGVGAGQGGDRAPAGPRHLWAARRLALGGGPPAAAGGLAERRIEREYIALVEGRPPARSGTIEAPIGRDPRVRTRMAVGGSVRARRAPTSRSSARCRHVAVAPAPGDGPHPPDPRAPAGDRPSRVRRPRVRHARACSGWSASSCTPRACPSSIPSRAVVASRCSRRLPADSRARSQRGRRAILNGSTEDLRPVRSRIAALPGARLRRPPGPRPPARHPIAYKGSNPWLK